MRKYPKKCPKCGEYMEPVFDEHIGQDHFGVPLPTSPLVQAKGWHCMRCDYHE